jgi:lipopolysaccharide export system protein LptA
MIFPLQPPASLELLPTNSSYCIECVSVPTIPQLIVGDSFVTQNKNKENEFIFKQELEPQTKTILTIRDRAGDRLEFSFPVSQNTPPPKQQQRKIEIDRVKAVEVLADTQTYDNEKGVIVAEGNVILRFGDAILTADRLQVNLPNRIAVAQGNVVLTRGEQVLRGEKFEYYFVQDSGTIFNASGEVYQPSLSRDLDGNILGESSNDLITDRPLSERLATNQPLQKITNTEGFNFVVGSTRDFNIIQQSTGLSSTQTGGKINRFRFQADKIDFDGKVWRASKIRITNDPFSPPELEIRAETAEFRNIAPLVDELISTNSQVVFDDGFSLPLFQDRLVFDRNPRQPSLFKIGFDGEERGGLFLERTFSLIDRDNFQFNVTPQYYLQRSLFPGAFGIEDKDKDRDSFISSAVFGIKSNLNWRIAERTNLNGNVLITSLDPDTIEERLRAKVQLQQKLGELNNPYNFRLEYNYRDRLFNGSLGFQTVHSSIGAIVTSPAIPIWNTGISLVYQGSIQNINADTDRLDLLNSVRENDRINLTRYQAAAFLSYGIPIWRGETLPPTATEGLRYTPKPVHPYLQINVGLSGVASLYSNDDVQKYLIGSIGLEGQFGHFSKSFFDYTGFKITFSQGIRDNPSPFKFDRFVDQKTLSLGITQQIYGPFRFGIQTSINLDNGNEISTDYILEYSRRTYNFVIRYNPVLEIGSIGFRISDFNWFGDPEPFDGNQIDPVVNGVNF